MKNPLFPTICVDDFFEDPEKIRNFALSQDFNYSPEGEYPGMRTEPLHKINPELFDYFTKKLFSIFYNFKIEKVNWIVSAYFQLIESHNDQQLDQGWIHLDDRSLFAGIIYLNKFSNPLAGTSLFDLNDNEIFDSDQTTKHKFYKNELSDTELYIDLLEKNNKKFEKTVEFKNKFNRLVAFDGSTFHKRDSFSNKHEPRLTLVFFTHEIESNRLPLVFDNH